MTRTSENNNYFARNSLASFFLALLLLAGMNAAGLCADFPTRTIRAIVPYSVGGYTDLTARLVSTHLAKELNQAIVVDNRPGAAGNIGMELAARSNPDGHTIMFNGSAATQNPALFRKLNFDPLKDLRPVGTISQAPYLIVVHAGLPVSNLSDFIKYARANPAKLNFASGGATTRLASELFMMQHNLKGEAIVYGGTGAAAVAIAGGDVQFGIMDSSGVIALIPTGRVKVLAVTGDKRLSTLPDIPTTAEAGFPSFKAGTGSSMFVSGRTPDPIVKTLNAALNKVLDLPEVKQQIEKMGGYAAPKDYAAVAAWYAQDIKTWKDIVARANIPPAD